MATVRNLHVVAGLCKQQRQQRDMSLRDLGNEIGVSASTLSRFENCDGDTDYRNVVRICEWLGVPLNTSDCEPADTLQGVQELLYADANLDDEIVPKLMEIIRVCYRLMARTRPKLRKVG